MVIPNCAICNLGINSAGRHPENLVSICKERLFGHFHYNFFYTCGLLMQILPLECITVMYMILEFYHVLVERED